MKNFLTLFCTIGTLCCSADIKISHQNTVNGLKGQEGGKEFVYLPKDAAIRKDAINFELPQVLEPGIWELDFELFGNWGTRNPNMVFEFDSDAKIAVEAGYFKLNNGVSKNSTILINQTPITKMKMYSTSKRAWDGIGFIELNIRPAAQNLDLINQRFYFEANVDSNGIVDWSENFPEAVYGLKLSDSTVITCNNTNGKTFKTPKTNDVKVFGKFKNLELDNPKIKTISGQRYVDPAIDYKITPLMQACDLNKIEKGTLTLDFDAPPTLPFYPYNKPICFVTSWDDGRDFDYQLADILEKYQVKGTLAMNNHSQILNDIKSFEKRGFEIASHSYSHPHMGNLSPKGCDLEYASMRGLLEEKLGHVVISFVYPFNYQQAYDEQGEYVIRKLKENGFWGARPTSYSRVKTIDKTQNEHILKSDFHFWEKPANVQARLDKARENKAGDFIYLWGHSYELVNGGAERLEENLAILGKQPDIWYATQGEYSIWSFIRRNLTIERKAPKEFEISLPWLNPYLKEQCSIFLLLPSNVTKALWNGKELPITDGYIEVNL